MAPHSSAVSWRIPWTGRLQTMGSLRVGHDWATDLPFTFYFHALEKEMAPHSSVLAWRIPGMGEPGGLPSMASHRVRHDWSDLATAAAAAATSCEELTHWKRPWCWEGLGAGGEGDDRGWDGWMASPTRWTWVWVNSRSWWWTGRPGAAIHGVAKSRTRLSDWTELILNKRQLQILNKLHTYRDASCQLNMIK